MPSLTWDAVNLDSDSLTGEDSLIDCSLLSNPTTDLLEEFAPIAISAPAHKGKHFLFSSPHVSLEEKRISLNESLC